MATPSAHDSQCKHWLLGLRPGDEPELEQSVQLAGQISLPVDESSR